MTWTAAIMPDDALPDDSLVGRMLKPEPVSEPCKLATPEPMPLCHSNEAALIIVSEMQAARALAIRMGKDPESISGPYLQMLLKHCREWEAQSIA